MRWSLLLPFAVALAALFGCPPDGGSSSTGGDSGGGDGGVGCPNGPEAKLNLKISAQNGPVPPDTRLLVSWSAADETPFELDDPTTWASPADGNVICDVDPTKPPPTDLAQLVCHLWTSGVTHVQVRATGYISYEGMLKPKYSAECKDWVATDVNVTLKPLPDAGAGGSAM